MMTFRDCFTMWYLNCRVYNVESTVNIFIGQFRWKFRLKSSNECPSPRRSPIDINYHRFDFQTLESKACVVENSTSLKDHHFEEWKMYPNSRLLASANLSLSDDTGLQILECKSIGGLVSRSRPVWDANVRRSKAYAELIQTGQSGSEQVEKPKSRCTDSVPLRRLPVEMLNKPNFKLEVIYWVLSVDNIKILIRSIFRMILK